jgi:two-component system cell cycle response regulator DivK
MRKILLVEDNEMNRDMLRRRLERRGFDVVLASDGREGILAAKIQSPDLILMDLSLPEIDGWEATRILKATPDVAEIPVLVVTAHATVSDRERALEAGCDDFETKPVIFDHLLKKMEHLLDRKAVLL